MEYYLWIKAFHFMAFISWMAVLFYLPRLYVYHAEHIEKLEFVRVVKIQEDKLYNFIGWPAMLGTVISGIAMIVLNPSMLSGSGWLHAKIFFAFLLLFYHFDNGRYLKLFREDRCFKSGKFFRFYNEVPTILMIGIVICGVLKPF
ncbi:MAG: protoporphyrinogen oxidase HemJ [Wolinella sp.]